MILKLEKIEKPSKKHLNKYKSGELKFKTKEQVSNIIEYKNGKKGRGQYEKMLNFIPRLSLKEFIDFLDKEIEKQHFNNKSIEYYETIFDRLEELKPLINDKLKFKYYIDKTEEALLESSKKNNFNYFEEKIKENPKYQKIFDILNGKYISTTLFAKDKEESYLSITKFNKNTNSQKINDNLADLLELLYEGKLDSSIHLMKVTNQRLKEIYKNNSDLEKYLKGKLRGIGAIEKIDKIYDNLDYDTAILFAIKAFQTGDYQKLEKIKNHLNGQNGNPKNNIDKKLLRAIKLEIKRLLEEENNKKEINKIIDILENSNEKKLLLSSIAKIKYLMETKKEQKSFEYFMFLLTGGSKKTRLANKNFKKINQLRRILTNLQSVHKSKTRDFLVEQIESKLNELETTERES